MVYLKEQYFFFTLLLGFGRCFASLFHLLLCFSTSCFICFCHVRTMPQHHTIIKQILARFSVLLLMLIVAHKIRIDLLLDAEYAHDGCLDWISRFLPTIWNVRHFEHNLAVACLTAFFRANKCVCVSMSHSEKEKKIAMAIANWIVLVGRHQPFY